MTTKSIPVRLGNWLTTAITLIAIGFYINYAVRNLTDIPPGENCRASIAIALFSVALVVFSVGIDWINLVHVVRAITALLCHGSKHKSFFPSPSSANISLGI